MDIQGYLSEIRTLYASGQTTEHSFRPALAELFSPINAELTVINEPKHITTDPIISTIEAPIGGDDKAT